MMVDHSNPAVEAPSPAQQALQLELKVYEELDFPGRMVGVTLWDGGAETFCGSQRSFFLIGTASTNGGFATQPGYQRAYDHGQE